MSQSPAARFQELTKSPYYLSAGDAGAVKTYLDAIGYREDKEVIRSANSAGEGNMNAALRIVTSQRTFILKQSRPWVAKFPQLAAPVERILVEKEFSEATEGVAEIAGRMPRILLADPKNFVVLMEDLGPVGDLTSIYADNTLLSNDDIDGLLDYATALHQLEPASFPKNDELKALNHAHIFDLPFRPDNGFPLDELQVGLAAIAKPYQHDEQLRKVVTALGQKYLATGTRLIHGDFYPGSFLRVGEKVFVIDAEFAHPGLPEFDLGVLMAHLHLARVPEDRLRRVEIDYVKPPGFDADLARRFCNVEIMRRLIGIAQLPLDLTPDDRRAHLARARTGLVQSSTNE